jgi:hypothetical protein
VLCRAELVRLLCVSFNVRLLLGFAIATLAWLYELSEAASGNVLRCGADDLRNDHRHFPFDIWHMYYGAGKLCDFCPGYVHMHTATNRKFLSIKDVRATARLDINFIFAVSLKSMIARRNNIAVSSQIYKAHRPMQLDTLNSTD